ncbi:MAG: hypothetical protein H7249_02765 [Chitinophagaceae bacterium]|nr:hypothetical protein [Oligoflexus sp.]
MNNPNEKTEVKKRRERKRFLNVIYFIDSNRTRTLKFSIGTSYVTVGLLCAAVIWSIISTSLLIRDHFILEGMRGHTTSLLETVFNYQTRYDEVYEKAYPVNDTSLLTAEKEKPKTEAKPTVSDSNALAQQAESPTPKEKAISQARASTEPPLAINNFSTIINDKNLLVRLSLKNLSTTSKVSGSVRAKAKFVDAENKTLVLESRPSRTREDNGNDEHFNIRYFKNKAMSFEIPKDTKGRFLEVTVTIKDDSGRSKDFAYPLNKEIQVAAKSAPIVKATVKDDDDSETDTHTDEIESKSNAPAEDAEMPTDSSN